MFKGRPYASSVCMCVDLNIYWYPAKRNLFKGQTRTSSSFFSHCFLYCLKDSKDNIILKTVKIRIRVKRMHLLSNIEFLLWSYNYCYCNYSSYYLCFHFSHYFIFILILLRKRIFNPFSYKQKDNFNISDLCLSPYEFICRTVYVCVCVCVLER